MYTSIIFSTALYIYIAIRSNAVAIANKTPKFYKRRKNLKKDSTS